MKYAVIGFAMLMSTAAVAQSYYGSYRNPIEDAPLDGDWSHPVHRGMYCVNGTWHLGWLREWEGKMVIKPSCGAAIRQLPLD